MAILAAGIFVAQMLNFPVGGGTSGHLIGATLTAILIGPYASMIVITTILIIQCFLFGDGGITALGLNIVNMAIIGSIVGWYIYRIVPERYNKIGMFIAAWLAVVFSACACAIELALSYELTNGTYGITPYISLPCMIGYHIVIGIGEAIITLGTITFLAVVAPAMIHHRKILSFAQQKEVVTE
jgi:cobalt/nickel transport system permease protein